MHHPMESTSEKCFCFGYRAVGEHFLADDKARKVLLALRHAKDVPAEKSAPASAKALRAARAPRQARDPAAPKRAYRRRDMRAEG